MENPFPTELPPSDPSSAPAHAETAPEATQVSAPVPTGESEQPAASVAEVSHESHGSSMQDDSHQEQEHTTGEPVAENQPEDQAVSPESEPIPGTLEDYAVRARKGRLNPEEEAEAARLLKEALLGGRAEVARAVTATPQLPWVVTVQATASVWPEIKPTFRAQFLAGLARTAGEAAARIRLSLARGLFKVDPAASLKLILLTLKVLRDKETGLLEGKGASILANVLIGRGKAWVLQLPLADLKPAEVDLLVFATVHGAFHQPQAPLTQLSILKWAAVADRLSKLPQALEQMVLKGVSRWSGKWQASLRREVAPLPDSWVDILKSPAPSGRGRGDAPSRQPSPRARLPKPRTLILLRAKRTPRALLLTRRILGTRKTTQTTGTRTMTRTTKTRRMPTNPIRANPPMHRTDAKSSVPFTFPRRSRARGIIRRNSSSREGAVSSLLTCRTPSGRWNSM